MYWTPSLLVELECAPWADGLTKDELLTFAEISFLSAIIIENLQQLADDDEKVYYDIHDLSDNIFTIDDFYECRAA